MGNCIETCSEEVQTTTDRPQLPQQEESLDDDDDYDDQNGVRCSCNDKDMMNVRIKIVLTKEELECLMEQLNNNSNTADQIGKRQKLEELLWEIQRSRERQLMQTVQPWRPCLETILEKE